MISPQARKDKLIRATDLDALSCRNSANKKGYISPPDQFIPDLLASYSAHLQYCVGYTQLSAGRTLRSAFGDPKLPLINRGTYFRAFSIDSVVTKFIRANEKCQIVSLGGGSDTRAFRVLNDNVTYTEIDFPELTKIKKLAIAKNPELQSLLKTELSPPDILLRQDFEAFGLDLHAPNYHLIGFDLRKIVENGERELLSYLDRDVPTLVISECVLCYLTPEENTQILSFWSQKLKSASVLMYEPMGLEDVFGSTMEQNLTNRGIDLHTFKEFPDLQSRKKFFLENAGYKTVRLTDMAEVGGYTGDRAWLLGEEAGRVSKLEMIDEIEEIRLLLRHYCLIYACNGDSIPESIEALGWLESS